VGTDRKPLTIITAEIGVIALAIMLIWLAVFVMVTVRLSEKVSEKVMGAIPL
jgi:hypothetical protein